MMSEMSLKKVDDKKKSEEPGCVSVNEQEWKNLAECIVGRKNPFSSNTLFSTDSKWLTKLRERAEVMCKDGMTNMMIFDEKVPTGSVQTLIAISYTLAVNPSMGSNRYRQNMKTAIHCHTTPLRTESKFDHEPTVRQVVRQLNSLTRVLEKEKKEKKNIGFHYEKELSKLRSIAEIMEESNLADWGERCQSVICAYESINSLEDATISHVTSPIRKTLRTIIQEMEEDISNVDGIQEALEELKLQ